MLDNKVRKMLGNKVFDKLLVCSFYLKTFVVHNMYYLWFDV